MSTTIENEVVSIRFDNEGFDKKVEESSKSLDRMRNALQLSGATNDIKLVEKAINGINLDKVANSIDTIASRFSVLGVSADQIIRNITNRTMSMGETILKTFTTKPVKTGFAEYETQINAVQTILANTKSAGTTIEQVNAALDELNVYADKTIYNFTEMARNIGTFTAAGVDLDTSVRSIKGIANLAAMSGSSAQQASSAMYQLSQALASGVVRWQDWISVQNAGMGGEIFKNELVKTAKALGGAGADVAAEIEKGNLKFKDSLEKEWLTAEVLTTTLEKFTDESTELGKTATDAATKVKTISQLWGTINENVQSGWAQSWEWIIGDFETARTLLTKISNKIGELLQPSIDARNKALEEWATKRDPLKQKADERNKVADDLSKANKKVTSESEEFAKAFAAADKVVQDTILGNYGNQPQRAGRLAAAGYSYKEVQPKVNEIMALLNKSNTEKSGSEQLADEETEVLTGREMFLKGLQNIWTSIYSIYDNVRQAFREVFPRTTGDQLTSLSEKFMNFTEKLKPLEKDLTNLKKTFKGLFSAFDLGFRFIKNIASGILSLLGFTPDLGSSILEVTGKVGDFLTKLNESTKAKGTFEELANSIKEHLQPISDWFKEFLGGADISGTLDTATNAIKNFFGLVDSGYQTFIDDKEKADKAVQNGTDPAEQVADVESPVATIATTMKAIDQDITDITTSATPAATALDKIEELWGKIVGWFSAITNEDVDSVAKVLNAAAFILVAAGIKKVSKSFSKLIDRVGGVTKSVKGAFDSIKDINTSIAKIGDAVKKKIQVESILALAAAVTLLVASVAILGSMDARQVMQGATAVAAVCGILLGAVKGFVKIVKSLSSVDRSMKIKTNNDKGLMGKLHNLFGKNNVKTQKSTNVRQATDGPAGGDLDPNSVFGTMCLFLLALTSSMMLLSVAVGILSFIPEEKLKNGLSALTTITTLLESFIMGVAHATANVKKSASKSKSFDNKSSKSKSRKHIGRYASGSRSTSNVESGSSSESNESSSEKSLDGVAGALIGFAVSVIALIGAIVFLSLIPTSMFERGYERIVMIAGLILLVLGVIGEVTTTIFKTVEKTDESTSKAHKKLSGFGKKAKEAKDSANGVADAVSDKDKDSKKSLKKTESTAKYIVGLAGIMMAFAAAISLLVVPIMILSFIPFDRLATGVIAVTALGVVMVLLTLALQKIANLHQENASLSSVSIAILAIAVALNLLVLPILLLGRMPWQQLAQGGGVLVIIMFMLMGFVDQLAKISSDEHMGDSLKGVAFALMGLVLSIAVLMKTIGTLSDVENPWKVVGIFSVISAFMAAFMGLLIGLTAVAGKTGGDPLKAAGAMAIAAVAFGAVVAALSFVLWKLAEVDPARLERAIEAFEVIAAAVIIFTAVIGAMMLAYKSLEKGAKVASGVETMEGAMDVLPEKLDKTGEAAEDIGKSSGKASKGLGKVMSTIGKVIVVISLAAIAFAVLIDSLVLLNEVDLNFDKIKNNFIGLIDVLIAAAPRIADLAIALIREFFRGLYSSLGAIYEEALAFVRELCETTLANQDLWELIKTAVCSLLDGIASQLGPIASSMVSFIVSLLNAVGEALTQNDNELAKAITNIVGSIIEVVGAILAIGWEAIFGTDFKTKMDSWGLDWDEMWNGVKNILDTVSKFIFTTVDAIIESLEGLFNGDLIDDFEYFLKAGYGSTDETEWLERHRALEVWDQTDYDEWNKKFKELGINASNYRTKLTEQEAAEIDSLVQYYNDGWTNGLENKFLDYWKIHSPSKRMEKHGKHLAEGLSKGIKENQSSVTDELNKLNDAIEDSSAKIPQNLKDNLSNAFDNFKGDVSKDKLNAEVDLSVTPVTDMSDFTDSLGDGKFKEKLEEKLNVNSDSLSTLLDKTGDNSLTADITDKLAMEDFSDYSYDDSELKSILENVDTDIQGLSTIMSDQKIYLDTGAVAGGIAPKVDSLLAIAGARSARVKGAYGG